MPAMLSNMVVSGSEDDFLSWYSKLNIDIKFSSPVTLIFIKRLVCLNNNFTLMG